MKPLVLMRGGGDIASGAVYRLKRAGYPVVISEIAIPTMIPFIVVKWFWNAL